jgi:transcriptional regulator with XRE-family HTH domain
MPLRLRSERLKRGWTQTRLSALTGIAASDLSVYENGHRRAGAGVRARLASVFGMAEADLFAPVAPEPVAVGASIPGEATER